MAKPVIIINYSFTFVVDAVVSSITILGDTNFFFLLVVCPYLRRHKKTCRMLDYDLKITMKMPYKIRIELKVRVLS